MLTNSRKEDKMLCVVTTNDQRRRYANKQPTRGQDAVRSDD